MSVISMKQLLEAGVHFGHQTKKWNPKMKQYIFAARNNIHIINLEETSVQIEKAYNFIKEFSTGKQNVLFVGTKKQAQEAVKEEAIRCGMYYVNTRWLGGTLTNFKTIKQRIERLNKLNQMEKVGEFELLPKKEVILLQQERAKLEKNLGGIKDMRDLPSVIFVIDPTREHICIKEANALNIPVVAVVDTNADPSGIACVIPANDDAIRAVKLITSAMADAVIEAREGVSKAEVVEDEEVNIKEALVKVAPTVEQAEADDEDKKFKKKSSAKKTAKKAENKEDETVETEVIEEKTEVKEEIKEEN